MTRKSTRPPVLLAAIILVFNACAAFFVVDIIQENTPFSGGYNREIMYVKDSTGNSTGYFIVVDDITRSKPVPVDILFHGLGNQTINGSSVRWETESGKGLVARVICDGNVTITPLLGYYAEKKDYIPYVKIRPSNHVKRVVTLLLPFTRDNPPVDVEVTRLSGDENDTFIVNIGGTDTLAFHLDPWATTGRVLVQANDTFFAGDYVLVRRGGSGNVTGIFANDATMVEANPGIFYHDDTPATFWLHANGSIVGASSRAEYEVPTHPSWTIDIADIEAVLKDAGHPFLFFNESWRDTLIDRVTSKEPWKTWYESAKSRVPPENERYDIEQGFYTRASNALYLAFIGYVENDTTLVDAAKKYLLHMGEVRDVYPQHLERSQCVSDYALAFDLVYKYLSPADISTIKDLLRDHARELYDMMYRAPANNWRVVMADGLAMTGFMVGDARYIQRADEQLDWYLRECTRAEGGIFEGQIYGGYTWRYGTRVAELLRRHGLRNYFTDPRLVATINFSIQCITPNGYYPMFEDCGYSTMTNDINGIFANRIDEAGYHDLAGHMRWFNTFHGDFLKSFHGIRAIFFYDYNISAVEPRIGVNGSVVFPDSGIACFRDRLDKQATYLTISSKHYLQSHVHRDENSIEVFVSGEKILTNPGYPGWGREHHLNWTIFSNASNTMLFDDGGQQSTTADGILEWLLIDDLNYVSCGGTNLYSVDRFKWT